MKNRTVTTLLYADAVDMGGTPVRQPFPTQKVEQIDPFLLLHHLDINLPEHIRPEHAGVGPHPHRGFSPVTFIFKGGVHHRDSRGNNSIVYAGGAQWMNAGRGIIHSERPPHDILDKGGRQEIIQLWINTPARYKMEQPEYFPVSAEEIPLYTTADGLANMNIIAGELLGLKGPVPTKTPVIATTVNCRRGGRLEIPLPVDHNVFVYILSGKISLGGYGLTDALHAAVFAQDGEGVMIEAMEDSCALLMSGRPLKEKVVSHGPFVMNTETQILEAMRDFQKGKMGILIEE
jgi:hypothetical protein